MQIIQQAHSHSQISTESNKTVKYNNVEYRRSTTVHTATKIDGLSKKRLNPSQTDVVVVVERTD